MIDVEWENEVKSQDRCVWYYFRLVPNGEINFLRKLNMSFSSQNF